MEQDQYNLLIVAFNDLHENLRDVASVVNALEDPYARELLDAAEMGLMKPLRRLRVYLDIPYDWREE